MTNILERVNTLHKKGSELTELIKYVDIKWLSDPAPAQDFYGTFFNFVDLADRYWYQVEDHHHNQHWKCKMLLSILRYAIVNTWVYATNSNYMNWKDFRKTLAKAMIKYML